jgi:hypothetical protein
MSFIAIEVDMNEQVSQVGKNIGQRIAAVMAEVGYVKKATDVDGKYKAVTHDQLVAVIRPAMVKHGIRVVTRLVSGQSVPSVIKDGKGWIRFEGVFELDLVNVDDKTDRETYSTAAHADDNGDKAPGKAITYAVKSILLKAFTLETGLNDEARGDIDVDRVIEIDAAMEAAPTLDELRKITEAAMAEAKEEGDKYAHKRFKHKGEELATKKFKNNEFMPQSTEQPAAPNMPRVADVDPETGEIKTPAATPPQQTSGPSPEGASGSAAGPFATDGMRKTIVSTMKRTKKTDDQMVKKFGFAIDKMPAAKVNEVIAWARAS